MGSAAESALEGTGGCGSPLVQNANHRNGATNFFMTCRYRGTIGEEQWQEVGGVDKARNRFYM